MRENTQLKKFFLDQYGMKFESTAYNVPNLNINVYNNFFLFLNIINSSNQNII